MMLKLTPDQARNILLLGAHSDDIEIGCGGTVLRLVERFPAAHFQWVVFSGDQRRAREAKASARAFLKGARHSHVAAHSFQDGFFPHQWAEIKKTFEALKAEIEPDLVFTHAGFDRHQDHRTISELTWNTFRRHLILEYEIPKYEGDLKNPNCYVPLSGREAKRKVRLLMRHFATQSNKCWFTEDLFTGLMRLRGIESGDGEPFAEAFHARKFTCL